MNANAPTPETEEAAVSAVPLTLLQRLHAVMQEVSYVQKDKPVSFGTGSYKAVTHDAVTAKIRPSLVKHGILYYPVAITRNEQKIADATPKRNAMWRTELDMTVRFRNVDNGADYIDVQTVGYGCDTGDKGPGKAESYAVKYALLKAFGLETGEDADNEASPPSETSKGKTVAPGPRGGRDKTPPADNEIKLYGYPENGKRETKTYARNVGGLKSWVTDFEIACGQDMGLYDTNSNMITVVMAAIDKLKLKDLREKMVEIEASILVERTHA